MIIPGYLDGFAPPFTESPLIDGSALMATDLFWPAYLHTVGGAAAAPFAFGIDPAGYVGELERRLLPRFSATRFGPEAVSVSFSATRRRLPLAYS